MSEVEQKGGWPERWLARKPNGRTDLVEGESPYRLEDLARNGFELQRYVSLQSVREKLRAPDFIDAVLRAADRNEEWETAVSDHTPEGEELWDRVAAVLAASFPEESPESDQVEMDSLRGELREEEEVVAALEESKADCERLLSKKIKELGNARKQRDEELRERLKAELEKCRFCNKCAYCGPLEEHPGCGYLAGVDLSLLSIFEDPS